MFKKAYSIILVVALLCATGFISIGYAALTDMLSINGSAEVQIPEGLFITKIEASTPTNLQNTSQSFAEFSTTVNTSFKRKGNSAGEITYTITVYNNTKYEYAYRALYYMSTYGSNNIVVENASGNNDSKINVVTKFDDGKIVKPGDYLIFTATYKVGRRVDSKNVLNLMLNYQFGINVESIDKAADIVHAKFLDILNTSSTYLTLVDVLDDKFDGEQEWTSNYVGNVGNAIDNDMMTVETLFAGQLTMMVNGQPQKAWVLIKHENLDGNEKTGDDYSVNFSWGPWTYTGCEMTLYMTVDTLDNANSWAPVYATVFTCDRDDDGNQISKWYKVGDSYYGEANVVGYKGESGGTGSFVTDNWRSYAGTYQVTEKYSYSIDAYVNIKTLMQEVDQSTINEFQRLITDAEIMIANPKYAGTGITEVEDAYARAAAYYTLNGEGKAVANQGTRRVWLIPVMNDLDHALIVAQEAIDEIEQGRK